MRLLVVEDEVKTGDYLKQGLSESGFQVSLARNGLDGHHFAMTELFDVIILDVMLPDVSGWRILQSLREANNETPVLFLSARDSVDDRVKGLELGADDYIGKPFDPRELVARVKSIIRRIVVNELPAKTLHTASFGDWTFDQSTLTLANNEGDSFMLSAAETEILMVLLNAPKQILSRERLLSEDATSFDRSIDVRMSRLRKKIEHDHKNPKIIKTVYGAGYIFTLEVTWQ